MGKAVDYLRPPQLISGESVYSCISGFVDKAIDQAISDYDKRQVNHRLNEVTDLMLQFKTVIDYKSNLTEPAFMMLFSKTQDLSSYFLDPSYGIKDPAASLPAFTTFVSTQHMPTINIWYANYAQIHNGGSSNASDADHRVIADLSAEVRTSVNDSDQLDISQPCACGKCGLVMRSLPFPIQ